MSYTKLLKQVDIFSDLNTERLNRIFSLSTERTYCSGEMIFHQNSPSETLYVIIRGEVEILVDPDLQPGGQDSEQPERMKVIARLRQGQSFGEIGLVDEGLRTASARSGSAETRLLVIHRTNLMRLCKEDLELGYILMRNLASDLAMKIRHIDLAINNQKGDNETRQRLLWSRLMQAVQRREHDQATPE